MKSIGRVTAKTLMIILGLSILLMFAMGGRIVPVNADGVSVNVGNKEQDNVVQTDFMVEIKDLSQDEVVYNNIFNTGVTVSAGSGTALALEVGNKYILTVMVPVGYAVQIEYTNSLSSAGRMRLATNSLIFDAQEGATYTMSFIVKLKSLAWFDDYTIY